jgi:hypothetical protein
MEAWDLNPTQPASDSLACGDIALVAGATASQDRIYVGSGEAPLGGGALFGVGPIVSLNGGASWNTEPVASGSDALAGSGFYALAVDPADANRVVAATRRGIYRRQPGGSGSTGFHWEQKTMGGATNQLATSVVVARAGGTTTFYATRQGGPVYSSTDGDTWSPVGSGFPTADVGRVGVAVQEGNPNVVYALVARSSNRHLLGVYRLDVSDGNWHQVTGVPNTLFGPDLTRGGQGSYDLAIAVAPNNVNRIYVGGSTARSGGEWSGSLYRCEVTVTTSAGSITGASATNTYIGGSIHADVHRIVFAPGDANKLWVGGDGGVFYTTNPTGSGNIFAARNTGLATLSMNHMGQHPTEDAVLFCGSQDNGGERFTGEEAWLHSVWGDCGYCVINWNDPYRVIATYVQAFVNRTTDGGTRYNWSDVDVPVASTEAVLFYAPLVGTPPNPGTPAEAHIAAFGSIRPWITTNFGTTWQSIPNGTLSGDSLVSPIRSMIFASADKLYAGTFVGWAFVPGTGWVNFTDGAVYRFDRTSTGWNRTRLDTMGGTNQLGLDGPITDIAVDPSDATGNSIYITFGGTSDYRHVWHFNGTQWQQRSGPSAGHANSLLDVQHNAIVVDPANTNHIYVGADIGTWRSTDGGATWTSFSEGLPDASVTDLKLHNPRRLLRASTYGRSVYERTLGTGPKLGVELYVRDTQLDQGRFTTVNGLDDPTDQGKQVKHYRGPDIKLDTPDSMGNYQFSLTGTIDFFEFTDTLTDDFRNVATHATSTITTRVYVQVHNRGVTPANNVRVMLLLSNASAGLPALPAGYATDVQNGTPINNANWQTVDITTLNDVRVGAPKIAAFNLTSDKLPPPASLAGNDHHCVLALVHHASDPYTSTQTHTDTNSRTERKAAHKNLKVVQFTGTLPSPPPVIIPVRINNAHLEEELLTDLLINLHGYPGRARLFIPPLGIDGDIEDLIEGMVRDQDFADYEKWAEQHVHMIEHSDPPYNELWVEQRILDIKLPMELGFMLAATNNKQVGLHRILMVPDSYHTLFLMLDRPEDGQIGQTFDVEFVQMDHEQEKLIGGMDLRVELVPKPELKEYRLKLWSHDWLWGYTVLRAQLYDVEGQALTPDDRAGVRLVLQIGNERPKDLGDMRWHRAWRSFYYFLRHAPQGARVLATGLVNGIEVTEAKLLLS